MNAEERALLIAPEGCDGRHPQGGCLFERVLDAIIAAEIAAQRKAMEECLQCCQTQRDTQHGDDFSGAIGKIEGRIHALIKGLEEE